MPNDALDQLKLDNPLIDYIFSEGYQLNDKKDYFTMICPFHDDKTPSMVIYPETNSFHCFGGCSSSGSIIDWLVLEKNCSVGEAIIILKNLDIPKFNFPKITNKPKVNKPISDKGIDYWTRSLEATPQAKQFFLDRGFTEETISKYGFGFDGERVTIPVWEGEPLISKCKGVRRRLIRTPMEGESKYIGVSGSNSPYPCGLDGAKDSDYIIVFAGELDCYLAQQYGLPAISVNAQNAFLSFPADWYKTLRAKHAITCFDYGETKMASLFAESWQTNHFDGEVYNFVWPMPNDFNDYILAGNNVSQFVDMIKEQMEKFLFLYNTRKLTGCITHV